MVLRRLPLLVLFLALEAQAKRVTGECRFDGGTINEDLIQQYQSLIDNMRSYQYRKKNSKDNFLAMIAPDCEANPYRPQFQAREKTGKKALENDRGAILTPCAGASRCRSTPATSCTAPGPT